MKNDDNDDKYRGPYFILDRNLLQPGDIILERGYKLHSEIIARYTNSRYSHAMIYVGGTIMEATQEGGVFSRIPNRSVVRDMNDFKVLRLKDLADTQAIKNICNKARSLTGSQYSLAEAILVKGPDAVKAFLSNSRKQFCSRLVVQCYLTEDIKLVNDPKFCAPGDIEKSELLEEIPNIVKEASEQEIAHALAPTVHEQHSADTAAYVKAALDILKRNGIKTIGSSDGEIVITTLNDISTAVYVNRDIPNLDLQMTEAIISSGYLNHIENDRKNNGFRYDFQLFRCVVEQEANGDIHELNEILRSELNKELSVLEVRLATYSAKRDKLQTGLRFAQAEFRIPDGLLRAMLERLRVIDEYISTKASTLRENEIGYDCKQAIKQIIHHAPEFIESN
ncbi:TPA: YiiX/YebB-like N1pC/P60 family cysteine hydrolase [Proteus mirabilis]